jgi:predicted alpha/beta-hydrolase family hydrolase
MLAFAFMYGTASTGTAVSTLSGAAATNAALAWWGGGSLAVGGGGIGGGTAVIATTAGVAAVAVVVVYVGYQTWKHFKTAKEQHRYLTGVVNLTRQRVREGRQLEWQTIY